jgi:hypothetical protein
MSYKINTESFTIAVETDQEALSILLKLLGLNMGSFCSYIGVEEQEVLVKNEEEVEVVAKWAIVYLRDMLNAELVHLGYVTKDLKAQGIFGGYSNLEAEINKERASGGLSGTQPIVINTKDIITEAGAIKIRYIANAENLLQDFLNNKTS